MSFDMLFYKAKRCDKAEAYELYYYNYYLRWREAQQYLWHPYIAGEFSDPFDESYHITMEDLPKDKFDILEKNAVYVEYEDWDYTKVLPRKSMFEEICIYPHCILLHNSFFDNIPDVCAAKNDMVKEITRDEFELWKSDCIEALYKINTFPDNLCDLELDIFKNFELLYEDMDKEMYITVLEDDIELIDYILTNTDFDNEMIVWIGIC